MELRNRTVLVTGGAGFIGSHLVDALLDVEGTQVRVLDNLATGLLGNLLQHHGNPRFKLAVGDVGDRTLVAEILRGVEVVFHLACRGVRHSLGYPLPNHHANATATLELLALSHQAKVRRFVHVSSSEVYGTARYVPMDEEHPCFPETVYGAAKLAGEAYARAYHQTYGLPTVVIRPFNNFGPRSHFEGDAGEVIPRFVVRALAGQPPLIYGDGEQTRDFLYVDDTAYWLCQAAACDALVGQTVNLASGVETSVRTLAGVVAEETGRAGLAPVHLPARPGDVLRHLGGVDRAVQLLGFAPRTALRQGVRRLFAALKARAEHDGGLIGQVPEVNWKVAA
jgi:UDP-glucose 4-epimerase